MVKVLIGLVVLLTACESRRGLTRSEYGGALYGGEAYGGPPDSATLDQWLADVGSANFAKREAATDKLITACQATFPNDTTVIQWILDHLPAADAEVNERLRRALRTCNPCESTKPPRAVTLLCDIHYVRNYKESVVKKGADGKWRCNPWCTFNSTPANCRTIAQETGRIITVPPQSIEPSIPFLADSQGPWNGGLVVPIETEPSQADCIQFLNADLVRLGESYDIHAACSRGGGSYTADVRREGGKVCD